MTTINPTHKEVRASLRGEVVPQAFALLGILNALSAQLEICGGSIARERNAVRRRDSESTHFAAARKGQFDLDKVGWQKRSGALLRKTFIITGIVNLSTDAAN